MKRSNSLRKLIALMLLPASIAHAGSTITFEPGPHGGERINAPWGTFIAVQHGNTVWVGTEDEYEYAYARAVSRDHGAKEFATTDGGKSTRIFIDAGMPKTSAGSTNIESIAVDTMFGVTSNAPIKRPKKRADEEYVSVVWLQNETAPITISFVDLSNQSAIRPYSCGQEKGSGFHYCETIVPRSSMGNPVALAFFKAGSAPGYLPAQSIAQLTYQSIRQHVTSLARDGITVSPTDPDDDSYRNLSILHQIDPAIPTTITASQ